MIVLGIESSCDECAAAIVEDGKTILSNIVATQIPFHREFSGVVPEIASRKHTEWIYGVVEEALSRAGKTPRDIDGVAATARPGLLGSLLVGLTFAKAFAWARRVPFIACDHILAHLYAARLLGKNGKNEKGGKNEKCGENEKNLPYPYIGLLVSGGHTIICRVDDFDSVEVLGTTIDDAVGEAFDKVAKHYGLAYPGGVYIDEAAKHGDDGVFAFPMPKLHKGAHLCDVSYSGLKTAVVNQLEQFRKKGRAGEINPCDIAASFQKTAVEILLRALLRASRGSGINTIVSGGGVAANSYLRSRLAQYAGLNCIFPPLELCGDNGAMVAGIAYQYFMRGDKSPFSATASARVKEFKRRYP
ncbi:MAG: tRNA (adenosine(37)-N6)-threonylcarbamoyltransferase complex transferase subunit TsaD [Spirochaetaceae bacterium]|jgi:N6-L-threonylcarbamoyladenine synthase|nr:tRNA (adenosine(37)-N6)-threonylcarbamoyltransferase complex transferase subunit TsaD [Spirochaetaceae bacterium]